MIRILPCDPGNGTHIHKYDSNTMDHAICARRYTAMVAPGRSRATA